MKKLKGFLALIGGALFILSFLFLSPVVTDSQTQDERGWIHCTHHGDFVTVEYGFENAVDSVHIVRHGYYYNEVHQVDEFARESITEIRPFFQVPHSREGTITDDKVANYAAYGTFRIEPDREYTYHVWRGSVACPTGRSLAKVTCAMGETVHPDPDPDPDPDPSDDSRDAQCHNYCQEKWGCPGKCQWKGIGCLRGCPTGWEHPTPSPNVCSWIFPCDICCCHCPPAEAEITCAGRTNNTITLSVRVKGGYDDLYLFRDGRMVTSLSQQNRTNWETISYTDRNLEPGTGYVYQVKSGTGGQSNVGQAKTCETSRDGLTCLERGNDFVVIGYHFSRLPASSPRIARTTTTAPRHIIAGSTGSTVSGRTNRIYVNPDGQAMYWGLYDCGCPGRRVSLLDETVECSPRGTTAVPQDVVPTVINLRPGWNMVSVPSGTLGLTDFSQRCGRTVMYGWSLSRYDYQTVPSLVPGQGYWVRVDQSCQVPLPTGEWRGSIGLTGAGWHMVGAPTGGIDLGAISHNCTITAPVWHWDPSAGDYSRATRLEPGRGYWFRTAGSCTLNF